MSNLVRASRELFSRTPDETFDSFDQLYQYCSTLQEHSIDRWDSPATFDEAIRAGWTRIRFVPESPAENYLGLCPECRKLIESSQ
jgi:hypothetical protein